MDHNMLQVGFENADDRRISANRRRNGPVLLPPGQRHPATPSTSSASASPGSTLLGSDSHTPTGGGHRRASPSAPAAWTWPSPWPAAPTYIRRCPGVVNVRLHRQAPPRGAAAKDVILEDAPHGEAVKGGLGKDLSRTPAPAWTPSPVPGPRHHRQHGRGDWAPPPPSSPATRWPAAFFIGAGPRGGLHAPWPPTPTPSTNGRYLDGRPRRPGARWPPCRTCPDKPARSVSSRRRRREGQPGLPRHLHRTLQLHLTSPSARRASWKGRQVSRLASRWSWRPPGSAPPCCLMLLPRTASLETSCCCAGARLLECALRRRASRHRLRPASTGRRLPAHLQPQLQRPHRHRLGRPDLPRPAPRPPPPAPSPAYVTDPRATLARYVRSCRRQHPRRLPRLRHRRHPPPAPPEDPAARSRSSRGPEHQAHARSTTPCPRPSVAKAACAVTWGTTSPPTTSCRATRAFCRIAPTFRIFRIIASRP